MRPHPFDPVSFIAGAVFTLIGVVFLLPMSPFGFIELITISGRWLWPALLLGLGLAIVASTFRAGRKGPGPEDSG